MDFQNLFPTTYTVRNNNSGIVAEFTSRIPEIPVNTEIFSDAYYMGYVRFDKMPFVWRTSQMAFDIPTATIKFTEITDMTAYPSIAYAGERYSISHYYVSTMFFDELESDVDTNGNPLNRWVNTTNAYNSGYTPRLINSWHPLGAAMYQVNLTFRCFTTGNNRSSDDATLSCTVTQYMDHFLSDTEFTLKFPTSGSTFDVKFSSFSDGKFSVDDTHTIAIIAYYFYNSPLRDSVGANISNASLGNVIGNIGYTTSGDVRHRILSYGSRQTHTWGVSESFAGWQSISSTGVISRFAAIQRQFYNDTGFISSMTTPIMGGFSGAFSLDEMNSLAPGDILDLDNRGFIHRHRETQLANFSLYHACTPSEIYHHMAFFRWVDSSENPYGYDSGHVWFPSIAADGEYRGELLTGTESELSEKLPAWVRHDDPTINEYQDGDKPSPSTPDSDDEITDRKHNEENSLPVIAGIRTVSGDAFSTFYHLSMYHVAELGHLLSQMPQTFWDALGTATDYRQTNILDYIVSLKWYPINIFDTTDTITSEIQLGFNGVSKIAFTAAGTSYKIGTINRVYDMGAITIPYRTTSQSFLDEEPYTSVSAYLPYVGTVTLQANAVIGYTLRCTYVVDLTTGMCTAILDNAFDTIYIGTGKIGVDISVSGNDIITQSEKMASAYVGAATGAVSNALSVGAATAAENPVGMISGAVGTLADISSSAISIANAKRGIPETVGAASGFGSTYTHQTPYITVNRPAVSIPEQYGHDVGYVCNRTYRLGDVSGYTVCTNPDIAGIPATSTEIDMIRALLCSGFYA